jgi:hypothetical protein
VGFSQIQSLVSSIFSEQHASLRMPQWRATNPRSQAATCATISESTSPAATRTSQSGSSFGCTWPREPILERLGNTHVDVFSHIGMWKVPTLPPNRGYYCSDLKRSDKRTWWTKRENCALAWAYHKASRSIQNGGSRTATLYISAGDLPVLSKFRLGLPGCVFKLRRGHQSVSVRTDMR